jgi:hypothetical protein
VLDVEGDNRNNLRKNPVNIHQLTRSNVRKDLNFSSSPTRTSN